MDLLSLTKSLKAQAAVERNETTSLGFQLSATGQVESGDIKGDDKLYVKYDLTYGRNWSIIHGVDKGISQLALKSESSAQSDGDPLVWNFPIDVIFRSLNVHGWPRLVVSVFGMDSLGRDVAKGYGSLHIPTRPGKYRRTMRLFRPICASYLQQFVAWLRGMQPEFYDSRFVAKSEGREATRVESVGYVTVQINVLTRGMRAQGYEDGSALPRNALKNNAALLTGGENNVENDGTVSDATMQGSRATNARTPLASR